VAVKKKKKRKAYKEVAVTEAELISELSEDLLDAWKKIRRFGESLGEQRIYASGKSVMFSRTICYFFVRMKKKCLEVCFFNPELVRSPLIHASERISKTRVWHQVRIIHADQVEEPLTDWLQRAYDTTR
jgi:hypothetical protein